jgi:hypothetical protein
MRLVDLRNFRYRVEDAGGFASWRTKEIVPQYNQAGLKKLAFVLPKGEQARRMKRCRWSATKVMFKLTLPAWRHLQGSMARLQRKAMTL